MIQFFVANRSAVDAFISKKWPTLEKITYDEWDDLEVLIKLFKPLEEVKK